MVQNPQVYVGEAERCIKVLIWKVRHKAGEDPKKPCYIMTLCNPG